MHVSKLFATAIAAFLVSIPAAQAQQRVQVGVLECRGGPNVGMIIASQAELDCIFRGSGRRPEPYVAVINRFGVQLGITDQTALAWAVHAPTWRMGRGALSGSYGGVGGNASIGVGGGGNLLLGGSANSYALQPLSLQGQVGLNVSGGVVGLELHPGGLAPRRQGRHQRRHR